MHQMRGLYYQVLNTVCHSAVQCLIHIVDMLVISCLYMIDDDLCGKCSSYRPVGIGCCNRILDTLDISHTAVVKGSTEAYYQNLVLTDLILIAGIILGSISGISAEIIGICIFSLYQFLLCVGQCIPCCLGICTLLIGILSSLLHIDGIDQCCYFIGCCLICIFGAFGSCCFRCLGSLRLSACLYSALCYFLRAATSGDAYSAQYGCQYYCYDSFFHVSSSDSFSVSFDFGVCPGVLKYVSQKHVFRNKNKNPFLYQVKGLYT